MVTIGEAGAAVTIAGKLKKVFPTKRFAVFLAKSASFFDRQAAIKVINKWTPNEAKELGFNRCDNDPHDGKIVYFEEYGRVENSKGRFKILKCPCCGYKYEKMIANYDNQPTKKPSSWMNR